MDVRLQILFEAPTAEDEASLRSFALGLTNNRDSVRVFAREDSRDWLVAEFMMPTEAQYKTVDRIDRAIRFSLGNRLDSIISFPKDATARRKRGRRKS